MKAVKKIARAEKREVDQEAKTQAKTETAGTKGKCSN